MRLLRSQTLHDLRRLKHSGSQRQPEGCGRSDSFLGSQKGRILSATLSRIGFTTESALAIPPPKRPLIRSNSAPNRLGSVLARTINRVAHLELFTETRVSTDEFFGNKAAESCYLFIQQALDCEDTDTLAAAFGNPPLPLFILQILKVNQAPDSLVEMVMLFVYRYYLLSEMDSERKVKKSSGHLIFMCAYLTAARIYFGPDSFESVVRCCKEQTNYSEQHLISIQQYFQMKVMNLCPISIMEERTLVPFFRYFRVVDNSTESTPVFSTYV